MGLSDGSATLPTHQYRSRRERRKDPDYVEQILARPRVDVPQLLKLKSKSSLLAFLAFLAVTKVPNARDAAARYYRATDGQPSGVGRQSRNRDTNTEDDDCRRDGRSQHEHDILFR